MRATGQPLRGRHILLTRAEEHGRALYDRLSGAGARVRSVAFTRTLPPADPEPLRSAARSLARFDWVVLTSSRAVDALAGALLSPGGRGTDPPEAGTGGPRWACVGPATARALRDRLGREADRMPERFDAEALADSMVGGGRPGRTLFPAAENARPELSSRLRAAGWEVVQVTAYRTVPAPPSLAEVLPPKGVAAWDCIAFTSGLVVKVFLGVLEPPMGKDEAGRWLEQCRPAVLGGSAEEALRQAGVRSFIRAVRPTAEDLAEAILEALAPPEGGG